MEVVSRFLLSFISPSASPHNMVPTCASVIGITNGALKDERVLSRLRRPELGESRCKQATTSKGKAGNTYEDQRKGVFNLKNHLLFSSQPIKVRLVINFIKDVLDVLLPPRFNCWL